MTVDRKSVVWAGKYQELLASFIAAMGGESIPPAKRAIARTLATMQTELSMLSDRFASTQGGTPDDLNMFLKISGVVGSLLQSVGLDTVLQKPPAANHDHNITMLVDTLNRITASHDEDNRQGIFYCDDARTVVPPGTEEYELCRVRFELDQKIERLRAGIIDAVPSPPEPATVVITKVGPPQPPTLSIVREQPAAEQVLTPEELHRRECAENDHKFRQYDASSGGSGLLTR